MNTTEILNLIETKEYDFLREDENLKNIILMTFGGSYAYGTNNENSDVDVRGIALNSKREILVGEDFEQVVDTDTDTTIYSFNKMITLLASCNPNTIEIVSPTNNYFRISPVGQELIDNRHIFLSRRAIKTFGGYATQQLYRLNQKSSHAMGQADLERHILKTINALNDNFKEKYHLSDDDFINLYIAASEQENMDTEIFMDVNLSHYPLRDYTGMWNELRNIVSSYTKIGKRNSRAIEHDKIGKHMMHLLRLYYMCFDILLDEEIITKRTKEHDLLIETRNGRFVTEDNQVKPEFFKLVDELEARLEEAARKTKLPDEPDMMLIDKLRMDVNERIVRGEF